MKMEESHSKGRKHYGKRRNCSLCAISSFPTMSSKDLVVLQTDKNKACLESVDLKLLTAPPGWLSGKV